MRALARACWRKRVANSWGPDGHRAAAHALGDALVDEHVEVTTDRHLAHVELVGELRDPHATVGVEAASHQLEPFEGLDVHRVTSWGSPSVARAVARVLEHSQRDALRQRVADGGRLDRAGRHRQVGAPSERVEIQR